MAGSLTHRAENSPQRRTRKRSFTGAHGKIRSGTFSTADLPSKRATDGQTISTKKKKKKSPRGSSPPPCADAPSVRKSASSMSLCHLGGLAVKRSLSDESSKRKSASFVSRFFRGKDSTSSSSEKCNTDLAQQLGERQARLAAKKHFASAATLLHPLPLCSRGLASSEDPGLQPGTMLDFKSPEVTAFLDGCLAKSASAQGMVVTPAIVNETLMLSRQFPDFPSILLPCLLTRMDGNLCAVQMCLVELGWGSSASMSDGSTSVRGRPQLEEFLDEPDAHFTTSYYLGLVPDLLTPLRLISLAPVGSFCTFLTQDGRTYQYHTLYKLALDILGSFQGKRPAKSRNATRLGAIVHENIVDPKLLASWRTSRRLTVPLVSRQLISADRDVPLLRERLCSTRKPRRAACEP